LHVNILFSKANFTHILLFLTIFYFFWFFLKNYWYNIFFSRRFYIVQWFPFVFSYKICVPDFGHMHRNLFLFLIWEKHPLEYHLIFGIPEWNFKLADPFFRGNFRPKSFILTLFYFTPFSPNTTIYYLRECILKIYLKIITRQCFTTTDFFFFITTACPKKTDCFIYDQIMAKIFSVLLFFDILLLQLSIDTGISLRKIYCVFPFRLLFTLSENVTRLPVPVFNAVK